LNCGSGPPDILSAHARRVVASVARSPRRPASLTALALLNPRGAPVVVYAEIQTAGDPRPGRILMTLFWRPGGGWLVDDLATLTR
jgi:hypothetical protein